MGTQKKRKQSRPRRPRRTDPEKYPARRSRKRHVRRLRIFLTVAAAVGVCAVISTTVLFRLALVEAVPGRRYSEEQLVEAAALEPGVNLFHADRKAAAEKICRELPYVEKAEVSIRLPDRIRITVTEAEPALQVLQDGFYYILSRDFKVLERSQQQNPAVSAVIRGAGLTDGEPGLPAGFENEAMPAELRKLSEQLEANQFSEVTEIRIAGLYSIELQYGEKLTIRLGSSGNLESKLQFARHLIDHKLNPDTAGTLDLSRGNGQAVFRPSFGSDPIIIPPREEESSSQKNE